MKLPPRHLRPHRMGRAAYKRLVLGWKQPPARRFYQLPRADRERMQRETVAILKETYGPHIRAWLSSPTMFFAKANRARRGKP